MALGDTGAGATAAAAPMGDKATGGEGTLDGVLAWSECSSSEEGAERDGPASSTLTQSAHQSAGGNSLQMCPPRCFPKLGTHQLMEVERYGLHRQSMTHSSSSIASESGTDVHGHFLLRGSNVRSSQAIHKAAPEGATLLLGPPHPKAPPRRPTAGRSGWGRSRLPTSRASGHPWRHNQGACREAKQTVSTGQTKEGTSRWLAQRGRLQRRWLSLAPRASTPTALANRRTGRRHMHSPTRLHQTDVGRWLKSTTSLGAQTTALTAPVADHWSRNRSRTLTGTGQVAQTIAA
jgi:hypothetical protein